MNKQEYREYLQTTHWKQTRKRKWDSVRGYCEDCHEWIPIRERNTHHLHYRSLWCEELEDLKALCETCHKIEHGIEETPQELPPKVKRTQLEAEVEAVLSEAEILAEWKKFRLGLFE